jgi:TonB family protein
MKYRLGAVCIAVLIFLSHAALSLAQTASGPSDSNKENSTNEKHLVAGMDGVSLPVCTFLPTPPITKEAKAAKFHGAVLLRGVVEFDGRITKIRVIKGAGLGLDDSAIDTLKKWKCKAPLKDGKPVLADTSFLFKFDAD